MRRKDQRMRRKGMTMRTECFLGMIDEKPDADKQLRKMSYNAYNFLILSYPMINIFICRKLDKYCSLKYV